MPQIRFPGEIQSVLAHAMRDIANGSGSRVASVRFLAARDLVCRHAHDTSLTPELMVLAVRDVYGSVIQNDVRSKERLRASFDELMSGWVQAYFDEGDRRRAMAADSA